MEGRVMTRFNHGPERSGASPLAVLAVTAIALTVLQPAVDDTRIPQQSRSDSTTMYEVDGIRVIHRRQAANNVVAANLYLLGGNRQHTRETAGTEAMLLQVTAYGTSNASREMLLRRLARLGTSVEAGADVDWSVMGIRATSSTFDSTWAVFADRLLNPRIDSSAVELVRAQMLTGARQSRDDPDALLEYLADSVEFLEHPYGLSPAGTEHSLLRITRAQLRQYHATQLVKSRLLLVIVGNVERAVVERLVRGTLARLPQGSYTWMLPDQPTNTERAVVFVQRRLPTNYVLGYFHGPPADSRDYAALRVASAILSGQLFAEIRSRRNLTYAVDAPFVERALATGGIYVTTVSPEMTLSLIREELTALQTGEIDREGLSRLVLQFLTEYFVNNETNAAQASFLARAQLYSGDYRRAAQFVDDLRAVTPADVRAVSRKYMRDFRFAYIGDSTVISRSVFARF
jgi:zinc protease